MYVGDQKFFGWWWDTALDATSADVVKEAGWASFLSYPSARWGHLYGT